MLEQNAYSTIRGVPKHKPADGYSMTALYDAFLKPPMLLGAVAGYVALLQKDHFPQRCIAAAAGDAEARLHVLMVLLSVVAGVRILQSLFLARRDYPHLESGFRDVLIFFFVLLFTSGGILIALEDKPHVALAAYAAGSFVGTINFYTLYAYRIPRTSDLYDYPVEHRIQAVNTLTFTYATAALLYSLYVHYRTGRATDSVLAAVASTCVPLVFNIFHSEELSMLPKFLLKNDPDSPAAMIQRFRKAFVQTAMSSSDAEISSRILAETNGAFKSVKLVRARRDDVDTIAEGLAREFDYMFGYLFATGDRSQVEAALKRMLLVAGGFGALGFMHFYMIRHRSEAVGFVKLDTEKRCGIYLALERLLLPVAFLRQFGVRGLWGIYQRSRAVIASQPRPDRGHVCLTYVVITPEARRAGFASAVVRLLVNALIGNVTNDIAGERIVVLVREQNVAALNLFRRCGFTPVDAATAPNPVNDPFLNVAGAGRPLYLAY